MCGPQADCPYHSLRLVETQEYRLGVSLASAARGAYPLIEQAGEPHLFAPNGDRGAALREKFSSKCACPQLTLMFPGPLVTLCDALALKNLLQEGFRFQAFNGWLGVCQLSPGLRRIASRLAADPGHHVHLGACVFGLGQSAESRKKP